ncbi:MAG: phosphatidate cytidylyltransferase [Alphaproteobacteria bacterium]
MLRLRLLSALVMLPAAVAAAYLGSPVFDVMVAAFAAVMAWEWETICRGRFGTAGVILAITGVAGALLAAAHPGLALAITAVGTIAAPVGGLPMASGERSVPGWLTAGAPYLVLPVIALVWLRAETGLGTLMWLLCVVWATDIGAFICGRTLGGPRLAPRISPKKTWSGAVGGLVAAVVVGLVAAVLLDLRPGLLALASAVTSVVSQVGDLLESWVKRRFDVKDSGSIIPGHGGVLDRVDGLLTAAPLVAAVVWLQGGGIMVWR